MFSAARVQLFGAFFGALVVAIAIGQNAKAAVLELSLTGSFTGPSVTMPAGTDQLPNGSLFFDGRTGFAATYTFDTETLNSGTFEVDGLDRSIFFVNEERLSSTDSFMVFWAFPGNPTPPADKEEFFYDVFFTASSPVFADGIQSTDFTLSNFSSISGQLGFKTNEIDPTDGVITNANVQRAQFVVTSLEVTTVPIPAALPLMGTGLAVLGFLGWRKRRKAHA